MTPEHPHQVSSDVNPMNPCRRLSKLLESSDSHSVVEVGTPYYTSPEICAAAQYSFSADVWSMGVILYELLCLEVRAHRVARVGQDNTSDYWSSLCFRLFEFI
jgi:serine/threonine protein kinase